MCCAVVGKIKRAHAVITHVHYTHVYIEDEIFYFIQTRDRNKVLRLACIGIARAVVFFAYSFFFLRCTAQSTTRESRRLYSNYTRFVCAFFFLSLCAVRFVSFCARDLTRTPCCKRSNRVRQAIQSQREMQFLLHVHIFTDRQQTARQ